MYEVLGPDGRLNWDIIHYRWERFSPHPDHAARRVARYIANTEDLNSLRRSDRRILGRYVGILMSEMGIVDFIPFSYQQRFLAIQGNRSSLSQPPDAEVSIQENPIGQTPNPGALPEFPA